MNRKATKLITLFVSVAIAGTSVSIAHTGAASAAETTGTFTYTDDNGETESVEVPANPAEVFAKAAGALKEFVDPSVDPDNAAEVVAVAARVIADAAANVDEVIRPTTRAVAIAKLIIWAGKVLNYTGGDGISPEAQATIDYWIGKLEYGFGLHALYGARGLSVAAGLAGFQILTTITLVVGTLHLALEGLEALTGWTDVDEYTWWGDAAYRVFGGGPEVTNTHPGIPSEVTREFPEPSEPGPQPDGDEPQPSAPEETPTTTTPDRQDPSERPGDDPLPDGGGGEESTTPTPSESTPPPEEEEAEGTFVEREPSPLDGEYVVTSHLNSDGSTTRTYVTREDGKIVSSRTETTPAPGSEGGGATEMPSEPGPPVDPEFLLTVVFPEFGKALEELSPSLVDPRITDPCGPTANADPEAGCGGESEGGSPDAIRSWLPLKPDCDRPEGCGVGTLSAAQLAQILQRDPQDLCGSYVGRTSTEEECDEPEGAVAPPPRPSPHRR